MLERGWGIHSFLLFFRDSLSEAVAEARRRPAVVRSVHVFAAVVLVTAVAAAFPLYRGAPAEYVRFAAVSTVAAAAFSLWLSLNLATLRRPDGSEPAGLGLANYLTVARFHLIAPVVLLLVHGHSRSAMVLYVVLVLTDVADGAIARARGEQTDFGVVMDPLADVFSTAAVFATFTWQGLVPVWLFAILMARYVMLIVGSFVMFLVVGPIRFKATPAGKVVGVVQALGVLAVVACVLVGPATLEAAAPVLFPVLGVAFGAVIASQFVIGYRNRRGWSVEEAG